MREFRCIYCGEWFEVEWDEDANYGSEPDCCDECDRRYSNVPDNDYYSDADPGL